LGKEKIMRVLGRNDARNYAVNEVLKELSPLRRDDVVFFTEEATPRLREMSSVTADAEVHELSDPALYVRFNRVLLKQEIVSILSS